MPALQVCAEGTGSGESEGSAAVCPPPMCFTLTETTQRGALSFVCVSKRRNKFREAKPLVQVHTAGGSEWWTKDASLGLSEVKSHTLSGSLKWKKGKGEESLY